MTRDQSLFVEFFSGSEHLTAEFASKGFVVLPIDIRKGKHFDMRKFELPALIKDFVIEHHKNGGTIYCHFAPPCNTYSSARYPKIRSTQHPNGLPKKLLTARDRVILAHANRVAKHTLHLMTEFSAAQIPVTIENPNSSLLFKTKQFKKWATAHGAGKTVLDYCMFGEGYRKRTALYSTPAPLLNGLKRLCPGTSAGGHEHSVQLSGWGTHGKNLATNKGSSAYPKQLCTEWSCIVISMLRPVD